MSFDNHDYSYYSAPGDIGVHAIGPNDIDVIVMGLRSEAEAAATIDRSAKAVQALDDLSCVAIALTLGTPERYRSATEIDVITDATILEMLLNAKTMKDAVRGLRHGSWYNLAEDKTRTVGRDPGNEIMLPSRGRGKNLSSRKHLTIAPFPEYFTRALRSDLWHGSIIQGSVEGHQPNAYDVRVTTYHSPTKHRVFVAQEDGELLQTSVTPNTNGSTIFHRNLG